MKWYYRVIDTNQWCLEQVLNNYVSQGWKIERIDLFDNIYIVVAKIQQRKIKIK